MNADPYKTLNVTKNSTQDEIKSSYRKLAKKFHPDFNPGKKEAENKFKEISAAYEMIGTPEERAKFDRGEFNEPPPGSRPGHGPFYHEASQGGEGRYTMGEDIFESFFGRAGQGGGRGRGRSIDLPGEDTLYKMDVDFKDAVLGAEKEITLGNGKRIRVKIPAGIESGKKLKFQGLGEAGIGKGPAGDALVEINVKESDQFRRHGHNLETDLAVTLAEAVLGSEVRVPTVDGGIMLKIPPGSNTGSKLRVKGKGVFHLSGQNRGDQIVTLKVMLPNPIDPDLKEAIEIWNAKHPQELVR